MNCRGNSGERHLPSYEPWTVFLILVITRFCSVCYRERSILVKIPDARTGFADFLKHSARVPPLRRRLARSTTRSSRSDLDPLRSSQAVAPRIGCRRWLLRTRFVVQQQCRLAASHREIDARQQLRVDQCAMHVAFRGIDFVALAQRVQAVALPGMQSCAPDVSVSSTMA